MNNDKVTVHNTIKVTVHNTISQQDRPSKKDNAETCMNPKGSNYCLGHVPKVHDLRIDWVRCVSGVASTTCTMLKDVGTITKQRNHMIPLKRERCRSLRRVSKSKIQIHRFRRALKAFRLSEKNRLQQLSSRQATEERNTGPH